MGCDGCGGIIHGAVGLTKAGLQAVGVPVDQAGDAETLRRRDICRHCPLATRSESPRFAVNNGLTSLSRCQRCSCLIAAKTRLASEHCPDGKW